MGIRVQARCLDCGMTFAVDHGGGFLFHLLRCDSCGKTKSVGFDELGELHLRYLKGLQVLSSSASAARDRYIQESASVERISENEYHRGIEALAGKCRCGGKYSLDAPPRCPECHSTRLEEGEATLCYD